MSSKILNLYKKPFDVDLDGGYIWDASNTLCLEARGWGQLSASLQISTEEAAKIQDAFIVHVAEALNAYKPFEVPSVGKVQP